MSITHTSLNRLSKSAPEVYDRSLSLALSDSKFTKSAGGSTSLVLDTTNVYITEGLDYKNYIFRVESDLNSQPDELKNLMIVRLRDSLTHQYLVTYKMLDAVTIDTTDVRIEGFFAEDLSGHIPMKCGGTETQMTWIPGHYVEMNCSAGGDHSPYEQCNGDRDEWGYVYWVPGRYNVQFVEQEPCDTFDPGNGSTGGRGGDPNTGNDNEEDEEEDDDPESIGIDIVPNKEFPDPVDLECKYLMDLLNDADVSDFNADLSELRDLARDEPYEVVYEYTQDVQDSTGAVSFYSASGSVSKPIAPVRTLSRNTIRIIFIHTHPKAEPGFSNQSMYSYADIQVFLNDILKVNLSGKDTSKMTNILVTADGGGISMYAIKKDPNSSVANNYHEHQQIVLGMTAQEKKDEQDDYEKAIKNAYYQQNSQEVMEIKALRLMEKMGLHLYKADNEFTTWKRLTLDPNPSDPRNPSLGTPESCD